MNNILWRTREGVWETDKAVRAGGEARAAQDHNHDLVASRFSILRIQGSSNLDRLPRIRRLNDCLEDGHAVDDLFLGNWKWCFTAHCRRECL